MLTCALREHRHLRLPSPPRPSRLLLRDHRSGRDGNLAGVDFLDEFWDARLGNVLCTLVSLRRAEARLLRRNVGSPARLSRICGQVGLLPLPASDLGTDCLGNRHSLARREVLADLVLVVLAVEYRRDVDDAGVDLRLAENVAAGAKPALTKDKLVPLGDADRLKKPMLLDAGGEPSQIAHVLAMAIANLDDRDHDCAALSLRRHRPAQQRLLLLKLRGVADHGKEGQMKRRTSRVKPPPRVDCARSVSGRGRYTGRRKASAFICEECPLMKKAA